MIDLKFVKGLIRALDESGVDSIEITRGGTRIRLSKTPPAAASANASVEPALKAQPAPANTAAAGASVGSETAEGSAAVASGPQLSDVASPMVGTFYRAPAPDAPPYVEVGSRVSKGDTLCIIEAMKLMNELESEVDGIVAEICVDNAEPVEYGQVLFRIQSVAASRS